MSVTGKYFSYTFYNGRQLVHDSNRDKVRDSNKEKIITVIKIKRKTHIHEFERQKEIRQGNRDKDGAGLVEVRHPLRIRI